MPRRNMLIIIRGRRTLISQPIISFRWQLTSIISLSLSLLLMCPSPSTTYCMCPEIWGAANRSPFVLVHTYSSGHEKEAEIRTSTTTYQASPAERNASSAKRGWAKVSSWRVESCWDQQFLLSAQIFLSLFLPLFLSLSLSLPLEMGCPRNRKIDLVTRLISKA